MRVFIYYGAIVFSTLSTGRICCTKCGYRRTYKLKNDGRYHCRRCRKKFYCSRTHGYDISAFHSLRAGFLFPCYNFNTKKYTVFEASIIGLLIGVIVSTYIMFVTSNDGFLGQILNWVSLRPLTTLFPLDGSQLLITSFIFFIFVYTVYGMIVGIIVKDINTPRRIIVPLIVIAAVMITEQAIGSIQIGNVISLNNNLDSSYQVAAVLHATTKKPTPPQQYLGKSTSTEAIGN